MPEMNLQAQLLVVAKAARKRLNRSAVANALSPDAAEIRNERDIQHNCEIAAFYAFKCLQAAEHRLRKSRRPALDKVVEEANLIAKDLQETTEAWLDTHDGFDWTHYHDALVTLTRTLTDRELRGPQSVYRSQYMRERGVKSGIPVLPNSESLKFVRVDNGTQVTGATEVANGVAYVEELPQDSLFEYEETNRLIGKLRDVLTPIEVRLLTQNIVHGMTHVAAAKLLIAEGQYPNTEEGLRRAAAMVGTTVHRAKRRAAERLGSRDVLVA